MAILEGTKARMVPLDIENHLDNYVRWLNDLEVTKYMLIGDCVMTQMQEREILMRLATGSDSDRFWAIETIDGEHIGTTALHQINHVHGTAMSGSFIGDKGCWGKGIGAELCKMRAWYAFTVLNLRQIHSSHLEGNEASRKMLEKAGYTKVGCWPKRFWKQGAYCDESLYLLTREQWLALSGGAMLW